MLLLAAFCSLAAPQDQTAPKAFDVFPLEPFVLRRQPVRPPPFGTLLTTSGSREDDLLGGQDEDSQFQADHAIQWLQGMHGPAFEADRMRVDSDGHRLFVWSDAELLEQVRAELKSLAEMLGRPIEIEATVYEWDDRPAPAGVADASAAGAATSGLRPLWRATARTRSSVRVALQQMRWSRYVRDVDVEVAQKSDLANPVLDAFCEGLAAAVEPHSLANTEDVVLFVQFALGQRRRVEGVSTGVARHPAIDLPVLETAYGASAARVPAGGALFVPLAGAAEAGSRLLLALSPRYPVPRAAERVGSVVALPCSALTSPALSVRPSPPRVRPFLHDEVGDIEFDEEFEGQHLEPDRLYQLLVASLGTEDASERVRLAGGFAFVSGGPDVAATVAATLQALQERFLRNVELRCRVELREADGTGPFAGESANANPRRLHDVALVSLPGRTAMLFRGVEQSVVRTLMPEIAQEASAVNPVVETLQSGLWTRFCPMPTPLGVAADLVVQFDQQSEPQPRNLAPGGLLMLTDTSSVQFRQREPWQPGRELVLGQGPVVTQGKAAYRSSVLARIALP